MSARPEVSLESRLAELAARAEPSADGWEQIQARAHRHDHRRRASMAVMLSIAVVATAIVAWPRLHPLHPLRPGTGVSVAGPTSQAPAAQALAPVAGAAAWISESRLWLLNGEGPARAVSGSSPAVDPQWSSDGHWVSYLRRPGGGLSQLWVVRPDGSANHRLWTGKLGGFAWSPTRAELAVSAAPAVGVGGLSLVSTDGIAQQIVTDKVEVNSFAWSGDGRQIAYAEVQAPAAPFRSPLKILTVHGTGSGTATTVYRAAPGDGIVLARWWLGGGGLLFWVEPQYSKSLEAQGLPLMNLALDGTASPVGLVPTPVYLPWLAGLPDSRVLVVIGSGSLPSDHKSLALCAVAGAGCMALPQPADKVAIDPAVSPDGRQVAFIVADQAEAATSSWYQSRRLWVADVFDWSRAHPVAGASPGAAAPSWSRDGQTLRYSTGQAVEAVPAAGGQSERLSGPAPLSGTPGLDGPNAYGRSGWTGHAVWSP